jgi:hypothetical protein
MRTGNGASGVPNDIQQIKKKEKVMRIFLHSLVIATLILTAYAGTTVFGQDPICKSSEGGRIVCTTSEKVPTNIGPVQASNSSRVSVHITEKSPFDDCSFGQITFAPINEADPIKAILQALAKASGFSIPGTASLMVSNTKVNDSPAGNLLNELLIWGAVLDGQNQAAQTKVDNANILARKVDDWFASPPRNASDFNAKFAEIRPLLEAAINGAEPSIDAEQIKYAAAKDRYQKLVAAGVPAKDQAALDAAGSALDDIAGLIAALKANSDALTAARVAMRSLRVFLNQRNDVVQKGSGFDAELFLPVARQSSAKTTITCTNAYTKIVVIDKLPVEIDFEKDSDLTVSAGILLSTTPKQKLGIVPQKTGVDANGVPTFKNVFGVVDRARTQIVPFSFLNYRLPFFKGSDPMNRPPVSLHLSLGVGVNSNSGSNEVEYFAGAAFGFKKYLVQFGDHIGRFQKGLNGGFALGDTVPANFPSALPINKVYKHCFGIAISYKLPL